MSDSKLYIKKLSKTAVTPVRGSKGAAGYDLSADENTVVPARGRQLVKTNIAIKFPEGYYARVAPRSGLAWKSGLDVGAGVVDSDYRNAVGVILFNHTDTDFKISQYDRIAQLILEKITTPEVVEVEELDETERGLNGFGSTGINAIDLLLKSTQAAKITPEPLSSSSSSS